MISIKVPLCVFLTYVLLIAPIVSKSGKKSRQLPKDEVIIGKHGAKLKAMYTESIANRSRLQGRFPLRSGESPASLFLYTPNVSDHGVWEEWKYCKNYGFIQDMKLIYRFDKKRDEDDSPGIHQIDFTCVNFYHGGKDVSLITGGNVKIIGETAASKRNSSSEFLECPGVVRQIWVRQLADMHCQDDLGIVNVKGSCAGKDKKEIFGLRHKGFLKGEWSPPLTCPSGSALCGVKSQVSLTSKSTNWPDMVSCDTAQDAYGIANMGFACCLLEDPGFLCIPQVTWKTRSDVVGYVNNRCTKSDDKGSPICKFRTKLGIEYSPDAPQAVVDVYENTGFPLKAARKILLENFEGSIDPIPGYNFSDIFRRIPLEPISTVVFASDCHGAIQELILECKVQEENNKKSIPMYSFYTGKYRCVSS